MHKCFRGLYKKMVFMDFYNADLGKLLFSDLS